MSNDKQSSINPRQYVTEVQTELKKVSWPGREDTINMTLLVLITSAVVAAYLGGLDYLFTRLISAII